MSQVLLPDDHVLSSGARAVDLTIGGQNGAMSNPANWTSAAYYTRQKLHQVLIQAPKALKYLPDGESLKKQLKAAIEMHPRSISGINQSLTVETNDTIIGNDGQVFQVPINVNREPSAPNFVWDELEGKPFTRLFRRIVVDLIMDPQTNKPGLLRYQSYTDAGRPEILPVDYTMVVLFIEPNKSMTGVVDAYLCANMFPLGIPDETLKEMGGANEQLEVALDFAAWTQVGDAVDEMAKNYLDSINVLGYAPSALAPFVAAIEPSLRDETLGPNGSYTNAVKAVADSITA